MHKGAKTQDAGKKRRALLIVVVAVFVAAAAGAGFAGGYLVSRKAAKKKIKEAYGCGGEVEGVPDVHPCFDSFDSESMEDVICWRKCLDDQAIRALEALKAHSLNVVTAESLTSGMIASTLVDITPGFGSYVYGGHSVYDSDAKRKFLSVQVGDVYTETCAREMAYGALQGSRAMVGVAVTGHAGPVDYEDLRTKLGRVDAAVSIRATTINTTATLWRNFSFCGADGSRSTRDVCQRVMDEADADPDGYSQVATLRAARASIRSETVAAALDMIATQVEAFCGTNNCSNLLPVSNEAYDGDYTEYGEPSWIIEMRLPNA